MGSILMTKAVCWVTPSKVMVVRSFEVVAAYVLQVCNSVSPYEENNYSPQVTVFDVPSHWTDILGTGAIISAVLGEFKCKNRIEKNLYALGMGLEDYVMDRLGWRFL